MLQFKHASDLVPLQSSVPVNTMNLNTAFDRDNLLKKSNSRSEIWNYFGFLPDETGKPIDDGKRTRLLS